MRTDRGMFTDGGAAARNFKNLWLTASRFALVVRAYICVCVRSLAIYVCVCELCGYVSIARL